MNEETKKEDGFVLSSSFPEALIVGGFPFARNYRRGKHLHALEKRLEDILKTMEEKEKVFNDKLD